MEEDFLSIIDIYWLLELIFTLVLMFSELKYYDTNFFIKYATVQNKQRLYHLYVDNFFALLHIR